MFKITAVAISVLAFQEVFGERLHVALIAEFEASRHVVFVMFPSRTRERACGRDEGLRGGSIVGQHAEHFANVPNVDDMTGFVCLDLFENADRPAPILARGDDVPAVIA